MCHMKVKRSLNLTPYPVTFQRLCHILRCYHSLMRLGNLAILLNFDAFHLRVQLSRVFGVLLSRLFDVPRQRVEVSEDLHGLLVTLLLSLEVVLLHLLLHSLEPLILEDRRINE